MQVTQAVPTVPAEGVLANNEFLTFTLGKEESGIDILRAIWLMDRIAA